MKQVVQSVRTGELRIVEAPEPIISSTEVLVRTRRSVVSPGTERAVRHLAKGSLLAKARARPDLVRQVVDKVKTDGLRATAESVRSRLDEEMPLGYSAAGVVVRVGEAVAGLAPGQRVATGGSGHAEVQVVPGHLAVPIPDSVSDDEAAFATLGAIALHGLRLADLGPGSDVCVIGLGLIGQLAVRLALAAGHRVTGIDIDADAVERANACGVSAFVETGDETTRAIVDATRGRGADAVLLTAATASPDPLRRAPSVARDRATVVVVGDVGLDFPRAPFYDKELTLKFARSYGPGRYDRSYEDWGVDYPIGYVRWTESRNIEAFIDLVANGRLAVRDLVTHVVPIEQAAEAYEVLDGKRGPFVAVQLSYDAPATPHEVAPSGRSADARTGTGIGLIGAGTFVRSTLLPAMKGADLSNVVAVTSASGVSAARLAERADVGRAVPTAADIIGDDDVDAVVVASSHSTHAELVVAVLEAGKHVFCEKPLALTQQELRAVIRAWQSSPGHLMVGFNRRHAPMVCEARRLLGSSDAPLVMTYRVNAGSLPPTHWYHDRREGGRLIGEVCHFIDTCSALVGESPHAVHAAGAGRAEVILEDNLAVTLRYPGGSVAAVTYAADGTARVPKERLEIVGRGHVIVIDDFQALYVDGVKHKGVASGKGHIEELRQFKALITRPEAPHDLTLSAIETMWATFGAVESLVGGHAVALEPSAGEPGLSADQRSREAPPVERPSSLESDVR